MIGEKVFRPEEMGIAPSLLKKYVLEFLKNIKRILIMLKNNDI
jgi:hypothetical protein